MSIPLTRLPPTVRQMQSYTDGQALPPVELVEFKPGGGRGRPRKGNEKITLDNMDDVRKMIREGRYRKYKQIVVHFHGDCHHWPAEVEQVYEKLMLVVKDLGIVASVTLSDPI